ncbi:hypothetical protein [Dulcicalothrix desertica]|nr:hypothetical protein [Dulcicalothrix desertica]
MARNLRHRNSRSRRSLISANKITPHVWRLNLFLNIHLKSVIV